MSKFEDSEWKKMESAQEFIENADFYILERKRLFEIMKSLYTHFLKDNTKNKLIKTLDIGCGDGILTQELLKVDKNLEGTLIDGSDEMLKNAKKRLKSYPTLKYIQTTFQELVKNDLTVKFDFIVSSLAIHHLSMDQKESLFKYIYNHLNDKGFFLNIDTIKASSTDLEEWYLTLWKEWITEKEIENEISESFQHIPTQYKNNPDNHPDTLKKQLNSLESIGFKNVDCYYKYGIFSIYGGQK
ncbi:MAG: class I SAM-dependent methyltransferase [Methanobacterium sp.]|uniref:class I SAM-dependent methyltransferase n=1 Tax=Methanobacterium sp. TaxID=2164 RepID=UPI003D6538B1|nr:class I SAM-dependent methyltransferase [Methanobacterium sp.]